MPKRQTSSPTDRTDILNVIQGVIIAAIIFIGVILMTIAFDEAMMAPSVQPESCISCTEQ